VEIESDPKKRGAGKTVLVVDDNSTMRKMLASAFLSDGFETCAEAENGRWAIRPAVSCGCKNSGERRRRGLREPKHILYVLSS
jgi:hypothetical protein